MSSLQSAIERLATLGEVERNPDARKTFLEFREQLTQGKIRAAEKINGDWKVNAWVKQGILLGFRLGELTRMGDDTLSFVDKDTFPARQFAVADRVRVVPGGSSVLRARWCGRGPCWGRGRFSPALRRFTTSYAARFTRPQKISRWKFPKTPWLYLDHER